MLTLIAGLFAHAGEAPVETRLWQDGYLDVGWFVTDGDGVAYKRDREHLVLGAGPDGEYTRASWVYYGDPWANPVNSQGDPADLGLAISAADRFDPIASGGRPTFLVNRFNHGFGVDHGDQLGIRAHLNFEPRTGKLGRPGDVLSVDTAYIVWRPWKQSDLKLYAGRLESGFGREYRYRHAPDRVGVTPSIMARYLVGLQTGVRVRGTVQRWFGYSLALTNGGTVTERFGHLNNDLDANGVPTATARVGATMRRPVRLEVGISGQAGPQDGQPHPGVVAWMVGFDAHVDAGKLAVGVEGVVTRHPGRADLVVDRLNARGGAIQLEYRPRVELALLGRVDWRDAELLADLRAQGASRGTNLYVSNVVRLTGGVRVDVNRNIALKAEYLHLDEVLPGTELRDDVFTTSAVFRYTTKSLEI